MGDTYTEVLVKKRTTMKGTLIKGALLFLTIFAAVVGILFYYFALFAAVALGVVCYFVFPYLNVEYEYLYVNGELDIDKIYSQIKRKRACSYDLRNMELIAPENSHQLDSYRNNKSIKTVDFSSGEPDAKVYAVIIPQEQELHRLLIEPNDEMLKDIRTKMPRKVFLD